jgi:hypothetical protein
MVRNRPLMWVSVALAVVAIGHLAAALGMTVAGADGDGWAWCAGVCFWIAASLLGDRAQTGRR